MKRFDRVNFLGYLLSDSPIMNGVYQPHVPRGPEVRNNRLLVEIPNIIQNYLVNMGNYDNKVGRINFIRYHDLTNCVHVFYATHLAIDLSAINIDLREIGHTCGQLAIEYFFGDWRNGYADRAPDGSIPTDWDEDKWSREKCRKEMHWAIGFHGSLLCTLIVNNIEATRKIAQWVDEDLCDTYWQENFSVEDILYLTVFGKIIRGEKWEYCNSIIEKISKSRRRRPKLLLEVLESIIKKDDVAFENSIQKYMKHFLKSEARIDEGYEGVISVYASVLWNYASLEGIKLPLFPEEIMDRIVTPQSVGLVK
jgi:hypothetical protein